MLKIEAGECGVMDGEWRMENAEESERGVIIINRKKKLTLFFVSIPTRREGQFVETAKHYAK